MDKKWNFINDKKDIKILLEEYSDFHDSCIHSMYYKGGAEVVNGRMKGIQPDQNILQIRFHSQMSEDQLELRFIGLRRCNIIGYRENYFCDISDCYLDFYNHFIIWSDNAYLNPENYVEEGILKYPLHSIIIADSLQWRKNESNQSCEFDILL